MVSHHQQLSNRVRYFSHLFLCAFVLNSSISLGQQDAGFSRQVETSYRLLLQLKMDSALAQLPPLGAPSESDYPAIIYIQNLRDVIELLINEDQTFYDQTSPNEKTRLDLLEKMSESDPYRLFLMAEVKLQWALVKMKFGEKFNGAWSVRQAYKYALQNSKSFPQFLPDNKTLGVLHILIGSVPEQYSWVLYLMGVEGSIVEGVEELRTIRNSKDFFQFESSILLAMIDAYLLDNRTDAIATVESYYQEQPQNILLEYLLASLLMKNNQAEKTITTIQPNNLQNSAYPPFPILFYLKGEAYLQKGDYTLAVSNFTQFLKQFKGKNLVKDVYYKIFLSYWLGGQSELAQENLDLARQNGTTYTEADKQADRQINEGYPNPVLMKIRLLTDGGYYSNALALIEQYQNTPFSTGKESVEFTYRQARLFHQMMQIDQAIENYKLTIEGSADEDWYFAPNSCLQLGYIYQRQGKLDLAREYFEKALTYKGHPYKNSIDNKAKSALGGLNP